MEKLLKRTSLQDGFRILKFFRGSMLDECLMAVGWAIRLAPDMVRVYDSDDEQRVIVVIEPMANSISMPFDHLRPFLATRIMRHDMPPVLTELSEDEASLRSEFGDVRFFVRVTLKLCHDLLWTGFVQSDKPLSHLSEPWIRAARLLDLHTQLRFVISGSNCMPYRKIAEFWRPDMVFPLRGGGSKEALILSTKNRLEAFLIAQGVSLDDVHSFCPELIKVSGPTSILQALDLDSSMKTIEALNDLSKKAKLSMPKMQDLHSRAATKLQKAIRQKALSCQKQLKACQFRLADDFFRNSDKTAAAVLPKFTLQSSGVALLDREDANKWIWNSTLMSDELAVIVLGGCGESMYLPFENAGFAGCNHLNEKF